MKTNNKSFVIDFLYIWRNIFIKRKIIDQLCIYKISNSSILNRNFESLDQFLQFKSEYKYIEYVDTVNLDLFINPKRISDIKIAATIKLNQDHDDKEKTTELISKNDQVNRFFNYTTNCDYGESVISLKFYNNYFNSHGFIFKDFKPSQLPKTVKELCFDTNKNITNYSYQETLAELNITNFEYPVTINKTIDMYSIPSNLTRLSFGDFNQKIEIGILPKTLVFLKFGIGFKTPLIVGSLPNGLKTLEFTNCWYHQLEPGLLPSSLTCLIMPGYNMPIKQGVLPNSLEKLQVNQYYILRDYKAQPSTVKGFISKLFNSGSDTIQKPIGAHIDYIPPIDCKLKSIEIGGFIEFKTLSHFNSLTSLSFFLMNHTLPPNMLPVSLTYLKFHNFNNGFKPIGKDVLPPNLQYFDPSSAFDQIFEIGVLPNKCLKCIKLGPEYKHTITKGVLPPCLEILEIERLYHNNISSIQHSFHIEDPTSIVYKCNQYIPHNLCNEFKDSISHLEFKQFSKFGHQDCEYPKNLKSLINNTLDDYHLELIVLNTSSFKTIRSSLTNLQFPNNFNINLNGSLLFMLNLKTLSLPNSFCQSLSNQLPNSIVTLKIGGIDGINSTLANTVSTSLETLYIDGCSIDNTCSTLFSKNFVNLCTIYCKNLTFQSVNNLDFGKYEIKMIS